MYPKDQRLHVICFPSILHSFHHLLEEEALFGLVELYRFQWDFIALDRNLLSLELGPNFFKEVFIKSDTSRQEKQFKTMRAIYKSQLT